MCPRTVEKKTTSNRGEGGVVITLSPKMRKTRKDAGEMLPKMTTNDGNLTSGMLMPIAIKIKCHFSCAKGACRKKYNDRVNVGMSVNSIYCPVEIDEHEKMIDFVSNFLTNLPPKKNVTSCQDSNSKVGMCDDEELDEPRYVALRKCGDSNKNTKSTNLVTFARNFNLKISNTWFKHKMYATQKDFAKK